MSSLLIVSLCVAAYFWFSKTSSNSPTSSEKSELPKAPFEIKDAIKHYQKFAVNNQTGTLTVEDVVRTRLAVDKFTQENEKSGACEPSKPLAWEEMGPNNIGGRTRAIQIDKDDNQRLYTGGVAGGMFLSTDQGLNWQPVSPPEYNMPVASITQSLDGTIYVGTGEYVPGLIFGLSNVATPASVGTGMYKSTDRGETYQRIESTYPGISRNRDVTGLNWGFVISLTSSSTDPNTIFAGTNRGIYLTNDAGETWKKVDNTGNQPVWGLEKDQNGRIYALVDNELFYSDNDTDFISISAQTNTFFSGSRARLAVSPSDPNYLYIVTATGEGGLNNVYQSKDGGQSWLIIGRGGSSQFNPCGSQCYYDLALQIDPINPTRIMLAGIMLWNWQEGKGWEQLEDYDFSENPNDFYYIHPDIHEVKYDPDDPNIMYVLSDGGITISFNAQEERPFFQSRNKGYNVTQFYGVAASYEGQVMGGSQDNGTSFVGFTQNSLLEGIDVFGGDGGYAEISHIDPNIMFAESQFSAMGRSSNGGQSFSRFYDNNIDSDNNFQIDGGAEFITTFFLYEDVDRFRNTGEKVASFFTGGFDGNLWMAPDVLNVSRVPNWQVIGTFGSGALSSLTHNRTGDDIFAINYSGRILRITDLQHDVDPVTKTLKDKDFRATTFSHPAFGGRSTTGIAMHPDNVLGEVVVTAGNYGQNDYIWISKNAKRGDTDLIEFESIQHNMPPIPIHDVVLNTIDPEHYIIVGTELGVWSFNKNEECWNEQNTGMGRVPVHRIRLQNMRDDICPVLYVGTHGRGFFRSTVFANPFLCDTSIEFDLGSVVDNEPTSLEEATLVQETVLYPNPTSDQLQVKMNLKSPIKELIVGIYGMDGKRIMEQQSSNQVAGSQQLQFDVRQLTSGNYLLNIYADGYKESHQFVKVN